MAWTRFSPIKHVLLPRRGSLLTDADAAVIHEQSPTFVRKEDIRPRPRTTLLSGDEMLFEENLLPTHALHPTQFARSTELDGPISDFVHALLPTRA